MHRASSMLINIQQHHVCCWQLQLHTHTSDVNKDLDVKAKDLSHKAKDLGPKAKGSRYQGQIFHRSSPYSVHHFYRAMH